MKTQKELTVNDIKANLLWKEMQQCSAPVRTAVENTWLKDINPEAIPEMVKALQYCELILRKLAEQNGLDKLNLVSIAQNKAKRSLENVIIK